MNPIAYLSRLVRRRWLASSKGLIVLGPEFIQNLADEIRPEAPILSRNLLRWLERRQRGQ